MASILDLFDSIADENKEVKSLCHRDKKYHIFTIMPALEMLCKLYSCWKRKEAKWVTTHSDETTEILLSLIRSEDCVNEDDHQDDDWVVLVLLINKDVFQRIPLSSKSVDENITFIGGESCMLVMSVQNYKWRVEIEGDNHLVEMLDTVRAMGLERLEVMCLSSWQKDLTRTLIIEWLNDKEFSNSIEEMRRKPGDYVNKLGLYWAKLSLSWDWTSLQLNFIKLMN